MTYIKISKYSNRPITWILTAYNSRRVPQWCFSSTDKDKIVEEKNKAEEREPQYFYRIEAYD